MNILQQLIILISNIISSLRITAIYCGPGVAGFYRVSIVVLVIIGVLVFSVLGGSDNGEYSGLSLVSTLFFAGKELLEFLILLISESRLDSDIFYLYAFSISLSLSNSANKLTKIVLFPFNVVVSIENLHLTEMLRSFRPLLVHKAGVYGFQNIETGEILYIGSSSNIWKRFLQHITGSHSNLVLQRAFAKSGLASFRFLVFEIISEEEHSNDTLKALLLATEQFYLDSFKPRYNLLPTAGSPLGYKHSEDSLAKMSAAKIGTSHTEETKAKMSAAKQGDKNPLFGKSPTVDTRAKMSAAKTGSNHPMFGKVGYNTRAVYVYNLENILVQQFDSRLDAAKGLGVSERTIRRYISSGAQFQGKYYIKNC